MKDWYYLFEKPVPDIGGQMFEISKCTKYRKDISVHGSVMMSSQFSTRQLLTSRINFRFHFNSANVPRRSEYLNVPNFLLKGRIIGGIVMMSAQF